MMKSGTWPNHCLTCISARARDHLPIVPCGDPVSHWPITRRPFLLLPTVVQRKPMSAKRRCAWSGLWTGEPASMKVSRTQSGISAAGAKAGELMSSNIDAGGCGRINHHLPQRYR